MKNALKFLYLTGFISLRVFAFSQSNYQTELKKLNDYFKTFDNGFYGYLEVKDGYLYDQFKSGKYVKTPIGQLGDVTVAETNRKVIISCKNGTECVYSTYTNSYHSFLQFSQTKDFNTTELVTLFTDFINALQRKNIDNSAAQNAAHNERLQNQKELQKPAPGSDPAKYTTQLTALNTYLKTFNSETYKDVVVKDNNVYFNFKAGAAAFSSYIPVIDLVQNTSILKASSFGSDEIKIFCKGSTKCFYSTYSNGNADHFRFFSNTVKDLTKMKQLIEEFVNALK